MTAPALHIRAALEQPELRKWTGRQTLLFTAATCGAFWLGVAALAWSLIR